MKQYFVGVDLGSANVVMVVGSREEGEQDINIEGISIQNSRKSIKQGRISTLLNSAVVNLGSTILQAKEELEEELGIKIEQCYFGLGDSNTRCVILEDMLPVKNKRTGTITNDDITLLRNQMAQIKPDSRAEGVWEYSPLCYFVNGQKQTLDPIGMQGSWLKGRYMLTVGMNDQHTYLKHLHHRVGMEIQNIFALPTITFPLFVTEVEAKEGVVIVDIGHEVTDVTVVRDNRVQFFRSLPVGAEFIDSDLKSILPSHSNLSKIKHCYGRALSSKTAENEVIKDGNKEIYRRNIATVIEARLMDIAELVARVVKESGFEDFIPHGYVLTGGSASIDMIDELFERELNHPCRKADKLHGINLKNNMLITPVEHAAVAIILQASKFAPSYVKELNEIDIAQPKDEQTEPATPVKVKITQPQRTAVTTQTTPEQPNNEVEDTPNQNEQDTTTETTDNSDNPEHKSEQTAPEGNKHNVFGKFFRYISRQMGGDDKVK